MIKAVIFDCFGVIVTDGLEALLVQIEQKDPAFDRNFVVEVIKQFSQGLIEQAESNRLITEHLHISVNEYRTLVRKGEVRDERVLALIKDLRRTYKTGLLSNIGKGSLTKRIDDQELSELFDCVVVSGEVGIIKPDPAIYELTAERLGVNTAECVFLDDRRDYVEGARATGMQAILYENFSQAKTALDELLVE